MTERRFAHSKAAGKTPTAQEVALANAYKAIFAGNGKREQGEMILADLANVTGYYRPPGYAEWMQRTKTPAGFELHCALCAARAEVFRHIMDFLAMDDDALIALERAARAEAR